MPLRTNSHRRLVITAEDTSELIVAATQLRMNGIQSHILQAPHQTRAIRIQDCLQAIICCHRTGIIDTDICGFRYRGIITTTKEIADSTALDIQECLLYLRASLAIIGVRCRVIAQFGALIVVVTITTAIELANEDMLP